MEALFETETEYQLILRMGLILLLGLLVGIERGWSLRHKKEGRRTAGIRTFTLIALAGGMWGILAQQFGDILLGFALIAFIIILMVGYFRYSSQTGDTGLTTEMAAFVTFSAGVAVILGYIFLSVTVVIVMTFILSIKPRLHRWLQTIESHELYSGLFFLIISAVLLPLLPNEGYGPWDVLNPFEIWGMVVLIAGISYVGYFSMKYLGKGKGLLFTSFTGSVVSSLAITVTLGRFSREMEHTGLLATGVMISTFTALIRIIVLVLIFKPALLLQVGASVLSMMLTVFILGVWVWSSSDKTKQSKTFGLKNPLQLGTAIQFGMLLVLVMLLTTASKQWLGDPGIYGLSLLSGMVDIDSIVLSLLRMGGDTLSSSAATNAIALAAIANTLVKGGIFLFFAGWNRSRKLVVLLLLIGLSGIPGLLLV